MIDNTQLTKTTTETIHRNIQGMNNQFARVYWQGPNHKNAHRQKEWIMDMLLLGKTPIKFPANTKPSRESPIHINWTYPGTHNKDGRTETTNRLIPNQDNTRELQHNKEAMREQPADLGAWGPTQPFYSCYDLQIQLEGLNEQVCTASGRYWWHFCTG